MALSVLPPGSFKSGDRFLIGGDLIVADPLRLLSVKGLQEMFKAPEDVSEWAWGDNPILIVQTGIGAPVPIVVGSDTERQVTPRSGRIMILPVDHEIRSDYLQPGIEEYTVKGLPKGEHRISVKRGPKGELNGLSSDTGLEIMIFDA